MTGSIEYIYNTEGMIDDEYAIMQEIFIFFLSYVNNLSIRFSIRFVLARDVSKASEVAAIAVITLT
jgi:hypothetical protein